MHKSQFPVLPLFNSNNLARFYSSYYSLDGLIELDSRLAFRLKNLNTGAFFLGASYFFYSFSSYTFSGFYYLFLTVDFLLNVFFSAYFSYKTFSVSLIISSKSGFLFYFGFDLFVAGALFLLTLGLLFSFLDILFYQLRSFTDGFLVDGLFLDGFFTDGSFETGFLLISLGVISSVYPL